MRRIIVLVSCVILPVSAIAVDCGCDVSDRKQAAFDQRLLLDSEEQDIAIATHLPFGIPVTAGATNEVLLRNEHYIINYDTDLKVPIWVAYRLRDSDVVSAVRQECFRTDIRLPDLADSPSCANYLGSGFDRGHMVPRADMNRSEAAMINSFMFTNMAPQIGIGFNRGFWAFFERRIRDWAEERREIYVITGSIYDRDNDGVRDDDNDPLKVVTEPGSEVAVPTHFFKIVMMDRPNESVDSIAIILEHRAFSFATSAAALKNAELENNIVTIRDVEDVTGIDFNTDIPATVANVIETTLALDLW